ncbi:MAG: hypothetical protein AVDCRST_MAG87-544 [uncultured Thermomicrobiales bacterium]|uniref:Uncharacterized protein n=1 Tax=uncultured Thermomicrobiales bacterium TaxID=1645740 RepID=A0A6J4UCR2_9BACT|nr:MAG: hypothetical protein AVDCRST_MAG87-544 [uncultured Thermomicrobiales bacterium]
MFFRDDPPGIDQESDGVEIPDANVHHRLDCPTPVGGKRARQSGST